MSKKEKPQKVAKGRYTYRGSKLRCMGTYAVAESIEWEAVNEDTDQVEHRASNLHELVAEIDKTLSNNQ